MPIKGSSVGLRLNRQETPKPLGASKCGHNFKAKPIKGASVRILLNRQETPKPLGASKCGHNFKAKYDIASRSGQTPAADPENLQVSDADCESRTKPDKGVDPALLPAGRSAPGAQKRKRLVLPMSRQQVTEMERQAKGSALGVGSSSGSGALAGTVAPEKMARFQGLFKKGAGRAPLPKKTMVAIAEASSIREVLGELHPRDSFLGDLPVREIIAPPEEPEDPFAYMLDQFEVPHGRRDEWEDVTIAMHPKSVPFVNAMLHGSQMDVADIEERPDGHLTTKILPDLLGRTCSEIYYHCRRADRMYELSRKAKRLADAERVKYEKLQGQLQEKVQALEMAHTERARYEEGMRKLEAKLRESRDVIQEKQHCVDHLEGSKKKAKHLVKKVVRQRDQLQDRLDAAMRHFDQVALELAAVRMQKEDEPTLGQYKYILMQYQPHVDFGFEADIGINVQPEMVAAADEVAAEGD